MSKSFNMLYANSYTFEIGYTPDSIEKLAKVLTLDTGSGEYAKDLTLAGHVNDMLIKIGFMLLARDYIQETNRKIPKSSVWINYHLSNFIYDAKAFLDSVAVTLNYFYKLGFKGGDIDFRKGNFVNKLESKASALAKEIIKQNDWIHKVIEWREALIHRFSTSVVISVTTEERDRLFETGNYNVMMPMEPVPFFELPKESERLKKKYGSVHQEILPFCDTWINNAKQMLETICQALADDFKS